MSDYDFKALKRQLQKVAFTQFLSFQPNAGVGKHVITNTCTRSSNRLHQKEKRIHIWKRGVVKILRQQSIWFNLVAYFVELSSLSTGNRGVSLASLLHSVCADFFLLHFSIVASLEYNAIKNIVRHQSAEIIRVCARKKHRITMTKCVTYPENEAKNEFHLFSRRWQLQKWFIYFKLRAHIYIFHLKLCFSLPLPLSSVFAHRMCDFFVSCCLHQQPSQFCNICKRIQAVQFE